MKLYFYLTCVILTLSSLAQADIPIRRGNPLKEKYAQIVRDAHLWVRKYKAEKYDCDDFAHSLQWYLQYVFDQKAKKDPSWKKVHARFVTLFEAKTTTQYYGPVEHRGKIYESPLFYNYEDGHAIVAIEDDANQNITFLEPQRDESYDVDLDLNGDGKIDYYRNPKEASFQLSAPTESNIFIGVFTNRKTAENLGWKMD